MMDLVWIIVSALFMISGMIGCFLPVVPGPPFSFVGLLVLQLREDAPFTTPFLIIWGLIVGAVTLLDYLLPALGARKWGGSKWGMWGAALGLLFGFGFGPLGLILGPFVGAFMGEWIQRRESAHAWRAAWGSFLGFAAGTLLKLITSSILFYYFIISL